MKEKDYLLIGALGLGAFYLIKTKTDQVLSPLTSFNDLSKIPTQISQDAGKMVVEAAANTGAGWNSGITALGQTVQALSENLVKSIQTLPENAPQAAVDTANLITTASNIITNPIIATATAIGASIGNSLISSSTTTAAPTANLTPVKPDTSINFSPTGQAYIDTGYSSQLIPSSPITQAASLLTPSNTSSGYSIGTSSSYSSSSNSSSSSGIKQATQAAPTSSNASSINWNKVTVGQIKSAGYSSLSEMKKALS